MEHRIVTAYKAEQLGSLTGSQRAELVPVLLEGSVYYRPMNRRERRERRASMRSRRLPEK